VFAGKVVLPAAPKGKSGAKPGARGLALVADDGTAQPIVEDDGLKCSLQTAGSGTARSD
jgi:hypothetical protein